MDARELREALQKQGTFVHEGDPILDAAVICQVAMADGLKTIESAVRAAADRASAAATQSVEASRKVGATIINDGASYLIEQFHVTAREVTAAMLAELRQEKMWTEQAQRTAIIAAWVTVCASACLVAGVTGFVLAGIGLR
jgi:protein-disulfide isomerase-like protein with CxxC motif